MLFNSVTFFLLHALGLILFWASPSQKLRVSILLVTSLVFYGWLYWPGLILLLLTILLNYFFTWWIDRKRIRYKLVVAVIVNLSSLGWFKYSAFAIENIQLLFDTLGFSLEIPKPDYWLPLGISFYTFQFLGYLIDLYRGDVKREKSLLHFAVFLCLYAQLVAGPIVRAKNLLPQLRAKVRFDPLHFQKGFFLMIAGLAIKVCVADLIAWYVDFGFALSDEVGTARAWLAMYGFSFQILSDFWGYSTMAIGIGLMYGIILPKNFNFPYRSKSFQEFWRRWHITLSKWFRDYLYIPLGGSKGKSNIYFNLVLTMTIAGVWHGAAWNFLIWGFLHGVFLAVERRFEWQVASGAKWNDILRIVFVFHITSFLWIFFRAETFADAISFIEKLILPPYDFDVSYWEPLIVTIVLFLLISPRLGKLFDDDRFIRLSLWRQVWVTFILLFLVIAYADLQLDFIYFIF